MQTLDLMIVNAKRFRVSILARHDKTAGHERGSMSIDQQIAETLGFPKQDYRAIERERRWLCHEVPREPILQTEMITDLYVTGARLRLREMRPADGTTPKFKLSRKADVDHQTRLITTIYLPEDEFAVLATALPGLRLRKLRHRLHCPPGIMIAIDEFQDELNGLILAEVEFKTPELLAAYPMPSFAIHEVTDDARFTGAYLVKNGIPIP